MVRRARSNRRVISLGATTANVSDYAVSAFDVYWLTVGGVQYDKARRADQRAAALGRLRWSPSDRGLFVSTADADGVSQVGLIPTPTEAGLAIEAFAAVEADDLELTSPLLVDEDYH